MALSWGHEREGAVTVLLVIPNDEAGYPLASNLQAQGESVLTKIFRLNMELLSLLDSARPEGYNDPLRAPVRGRA